MKDSISSIRSMYILTSCAQCLMAKWLRFYLVQGGGGGNTRGGEYEVQEKWMTFIALDKSDAEMIYTMVKQSLLAYGLTFDNCRGQASDGASVMRGRKNGVSTRILRDYPLAIYSYCSGHGLSLICQDAVSSHPDLKKIQEYIRDILAFIQYSPRRRSEFNALVLDQAQEEILLAEDEGRPAVPQAKANLRPLCVTRWVLRAPAMDAFCASYSKILDYMIEIQGGTVKGTSSKNKDIAVGYVKLFTSSRHISARGCYNVSTISLVPSMQKFKVVNVRWVACATRS